MGGVCNPELLNCFFNLHLVSSILSTAIITEDTKDMDINIFQLLTHENIIFLAILSCGLYTGYTDFRYGKIANIYTLFLIGLGICSQVMFINEGSITWLHSCINLLGGLGISFTMFYMGIWAAGDAKLFWGISLLMPPSVFSQTTATQFYPLILLVNIFVLFLIYVSIRSIFKIPLQGHRRLISANFITHVKQFPRRILQVLSHIGVGGLAFYIPGKLQVELDLAVQLTMFASIIITFNKMVEKYIPKNYDVAFHIPFVFLAIFLGIRSLTDLGMLVSVIFCFSLFLIMFGSFIRSLFTKLTPITDLKSKMIPAERILTVKTPDGADHYVKVPANFANPAEESIIVDVSSEGLTNTQISRLRRLAETGCFQGFGNNLRIQEKIPFAFMIISGALANILAKGLLPSLIGRLDLSQIL